MLLILKSFIIFLFYFVSNAQGEIKECKWNDKKNVPCVTIIKPTPNTSIISEIGVRKNIITAKEINDYGAIDVNDVLKMVSGINLTQSGPRGQQTSVFTRGTNSNHTLVLLNGIPINDQSTTQGLHDFGVEFIQNIQQVEVYTGPNGAHFGSNAIGGAINFITSNDFINKIKITGSNNKNNTISTNYNTITDDGLALNLKLALTNSKTNSAKYNGIEKDSLKNINGNLNIEKWLNENLKFKTTFLGRNTIAEYDGSSSEGEYTGDNLMYGAQIGLDYQRNNTEDSIILHYHKYDREYREAGTVDEYGSNAYTLRGERKAQLSDKISYGFGGEFKYDWGEFENNGSYSSSTKGHTDNKGLFSNIGFKPYENTIISLYARSDDHKTTGINNTYKINFTQNIDRLKIGATHSTGLRNPSLYELYGTDSTGYSGNTKLDPEKSSSNEIYGEYNISKDFLVSVTGFKSNIYNQVEYSNKQYINNSTNIDLNQSGVETAISWKNKNQKISLFGSSLSSKKTNGVDQLRRPEKTYGIKYTNKFNNSLIGPVQLSFDYNHYGKHWDTHSTNWSTTLMDSTDIINLALIKNFLGQEFSINITNLFDEGYQRPHGYTQDGRKIRFGFAKKY